MNRILPRLLENWPVATIGLGLIIIVILFYGCESKPAVRIDSQTRDANAADECSAQLMDGISRVQPENLGVVGTTTNLAGSPQGAAETLSQWLRRDDCQSAIPTRPVPEEAVALMKRLVGSDVAASLLDEDMDAFNAADLRDAFLNFETAENLSAGVTDDVQRVQKIFNYVVRVVSPEAQSSVELTHSGFEAELFGRGSAEARAWLFANLLRQLRIDAVILRPGRESAESDGPWWIGVPIRGDVYLFDARLGLPVPAPEAKFTGESPLPPPATWGEVVASPELLTDYRETAGLEVAPIDPAGLKPPRVELIGPRTYWKKAIERLELSLREHRGVLLFDPLQSTAAGPGLYERIVAAGQGLWPAEAIDVWKYPETYRRDRGELLVTDEDARRQSRPRQERLDQRIAPLLGPVLVERERVRPQVLPPNEMSREGQESKKLWLTRIGQISRTGGGVISSLQQIVAEAISPDPTLPPRAHSLNRQASDEAAYWSGHAQYRAQAWDVALTTIENYIRNNGDRSGEAAALRVLVLAEQEKWEAAIKAARELPETVPGRERFVYLADWWASAMKE